MPIVLLFVVVIASRVAGEGVVEIMKENPGLISKPVDKVRPKEAACMDWGAVKRVEGRNAWLR